MARYKVTAPYVTVVTDTPQGRRLVGLHTGSPVPADVDQDVIDRHVAIGYMAEVPEAAPPPEPEKAPEPKAKVVTPGKAGGG